jgi:hypothetical protein
MNTSQSTLYEGISLSLSAQAITLMKRIGSLQDRIAKTTQQIADKKFPNSILRSVEFQPPGGMDKGTLDPLQASEKTQILELEITLQGRRLQSLEAYFILLSNDLELFKTAEGLKPKILTLLPILHNRPAIITDIVFDIHLRISKHTAAKAPAAVAGAAEPMVVVAANEQPPTLESMALQLKEMQALLNKLGKGTDPHLHRQGSAATSDGSRNQKKKKQEPPSRSGSPSTQERRNRQDQGHQDHGKPGNRKAQPKSKASQPKTNGSSTGSKGK